MSTQENLNNENKANNGWQNIGICKKFARKNVPAKLRTVWMELVEDSFGHCKRKTSQKTWEVLAKLIKTNILKPHQILERGLDQFSYRSYYEDRDITKDYYYDTLKEITQNHFDLFLGD